MSFTKSRPVIGSTLEQITNTYSKPGPVEHLASQFLTVGLVVAFKAVVVVVVVVVVAVAVEIAVLLGLQNSPVEETQT